MKTLREVLTLLGVFVPVVWLCTVWHSLPAVLPSHFGVDGMPNRFAPRGFVWVLAAVSVAMYALLLVIRKFPSHMNLPRPVGDPDRPRLEALGVELIAWMRLELAWMFAYLIWSVVEVGTRHNEGLGEGFLFVSIGVVIATAVRFVIKMKRPV